MTTATARKSKAKKATADSNGEDTGPAQLVLKTSFVDADSLEFAPRGARGSKWASFVKDVLELDDGGALKVAVPQDYKADGWRNRISNVIYNRVTKPGHGDGYLYSTRCTKDGKFVAVLCSKATKG
jgi:hypothetical protein